MTWIPNTIEIYRQLRLTMCVWWGWKIHIFFSQNKYYYPEGFTIVGNEEYNLCVSLVYTLIHRNLPSTTWRVRQVFFFSLTLSALSISLSLFPYKSLPRDICMVESYTTYNCAYLAAWQYEWNLESIKFIKNQSDVQTIKCYLTSYCIDFLAV